VQDVLKRATGNYVVGDQFWDRETELALFIERLREGAHLLLTAPRRTGKTSLMLEAARRLQDDYLCLYVDLQKSHSPADAIVELALASHKHAPLWEKTKSVFRNVLDGIESIKFEELAVTLRSGLTAGDWQSKGDSLFEILAANSKPVVLLLDEVPILVNRLLKGSDYTITPERRATADAFLSWLRSNGIRHPGKITMVIAGSIGLEPVVRQGGLSATLNTLTPFELRPWSRETAAACLRALAAGHQLTLPPEAVDEMLDRLGVCIPHYVQMFFDYAYREARLRGGNEVSRDLAAEVYRHSMLGTRGHAELTHLEERLTTVLGPQLQLLALDLLTEAAVAASLSSAAAEVLARAHCGEEWIERLRDVLAILEHDGYLRARGGSYVFVSRLLKDWWKARFKFAYVPVKKRSPRR